MVIYIIILGALVLAFLYRVVARDLTSASMVGMVLILTMLIGVLAPLEEKVDTVRIDKIVKVKEFDPGLGEYYTANYYLLHKKWNSYTKQIDCITDSCVLKRWYGITGLGVEMDYAVLVLCY